MTHDDKNTEDKELSREFFVVLMLMWMLIAALLDL